MADLTITPSTTVQVDGGVIDGIAGATITAGQAVYLDTTAGTFKLAQADGTALEATVAGVALHGASSGQPLRVQASGTITIGGTVTVGKVYVVSATAGGICPVADIVTTGYYISVIGVGKTSSTIVININNSGATIP